MSVALTREQNPPPLAKRRRRLSVVRPATWKTHRWPVGTVVRPVVKQANKRCLNLVKQERGRVKALPPFPFRRGCGATEKDKILDNIITASIDSRPLFKKTTSSLQHENRRHGLSGVEKS